MKVVILAGGLGSRLGEETDIRPKPMVTIGGRPIIWHIMKSYSAYNINEFIICLGYKGYMIKEYFANYILHTSDVTIDLAKNQVQIHQSFSEPWKVTLVDTGEDTMTGGRIKRVSKFLGQDEDFCMTYGDGLSDVNINEVIKFHKSHGKLATLTAVQPPGRYGSLSLSGHLVDRFEEKPVGDGAWINGGFFVLSPRVIDYIDGDSTVWEQKPLTGLAKDGQLSAYRYNGFWQCMDTLRDRRLLEQYWNSGNVPWRKW